MSIETRSTLAPAPALATVSCHVLLRCCGQGGTAGMPLECRRPSPRALTRVCVVLVVPWTSGQGAERRGGKEGAV
ncbi:hypothetical protein NDU88_008450 [Pleurodeles waltl]|uniref:Secreted protein n=1 Tax=Pleurodeles waltl TaxID=8319 RepID=A0AAV7NZ60_PLEWA|nr:hypothetical protein NDU88_008394 [Pleurodeles waltl]KAJ1120238.1 hypothetical protein NDU88_008412 [Pleurodeles waltl]KAJ1120276.1 hypothetical protein NDU88_008450 [Pleurodeles waltl]